MKTITSKKQFVLLFFTFHFSLFILHAQNVGINSTGATPDKSAILDLNVSPNFNAGFLLPRMTTAQRNNLPASCSCTPAQGLQIYNTTDSCLEIYIGSVWHSIFCSNSACITPSAAGTITGTATVCQSQSGVAYSVGAITGAAGYTWTYTGTGFSIATGNNSNSITANFSASATSGNLTVYGTNACGNGTTSATYPITVNTSPPTPTSGSNSPSSTQIIWNWNTASGATAYYYNTVNNFSTATNNGNNTSYTQTGLTCNTPYTLYVWADNACGNSVFATLTQTTSSCAPACGGSGIINTMAGDYTAGGFAGDGGQATGAELNGPCGVAFDASGNIYIAEYSNYRIRRVTTSGIITTFAGSATQGFGGDGGQATGAALQSPNGIATDVSGNIYFSDEGNQRIRKITASSGIINTIAGNGGHTYSGDGGQATNAELWDPVGVAIDASGNVYIADFGDHRIRKITVSTGIINTIAGNGANGYTGDTGPATSAELCNPDGVAFDASGNIYISDQCDNIRKIMVSTGIINTIAGSTQGFSGDAGQATSAQLNNPMGVTVDASGNIYIADFFNQRIRRVNTSGIISTFAGSSLTGGFSGDGGQATSAELNYPGAPVAFDANGNVYFSDGSNNRVRKVCH
jgi:hypothetical protein